MKRSELKREEERAYWLYIKVTDLERKLYEQKAHGLKLNVQEQYDVSLIDEYQSSYFNSLTKLANCYGLMSKDQAQKRLFNKYKELKKL